MEAKNSGIYILTRQKQIWQTEETQHQQASKEI